MTGGKTRLLPQLFSHFPKEFSTYHEPFLGAGSVYLALWNAGVFGDPLHAHLGRQSVYLSDANFDVVRVFNEIRDNLPSVKMWLENYVEDANRRGLEAFYYALRDESGCVRLKAQEAARTLYLNKTCFNGLLRYSRSGRFNVTCGKTSSGEPIAPSFDFDNYEAVSEAMKPVLRAYAIDFEGSFEIASEGSFVYADPPYSGGFVAYTAASWTRDDDRRLVACASDLAERGGFTVISNTSASPFVDIAKKHFTDSSVKWSIHNIDVSRNASRDGACRGNETEVVFKVGF